MPKIDLEAYEAEAAIRIEDVHGAVECTRHRRGSDWCDECRPSQRLLELIARVRELEDACDAVLATAMDYYDEKMLEQVRAALRGETKGETDAK